MSSYTHSKPMGFKNKICGFSMVEVIIAIGILAVLASYAFSFIKGIRTDIEYTSEHFFSTIVTQKIIEDIIEEFSINPIAPNTLGINQIPNDFSEIVDGSSIFFKFIEDKNPPWGIIDPRNDGSLDSSYQPIYNCLKKFKHKVWTQQIPSKPNLLECNINIKWQTDKGPGESHSKLQLFSPSTPKRVNLSLNLDENQIDMQIPRVAFGLPNMTIAQIAARYQENVETITSWGRIAVILKQFLNSPQYRSSVQRITNYKNALAADNYTDLHTTYNNILNVANAWYEHSKMLLQIVNYLINQFEILRVNARFQNNFRFVNRTALIQDIGKFKIICEDLFGSLVQARYYYYLLLSPSIAKYKGNKIQLHVILRLLDLYRVCAIIPNRTNGMRELSNFLDRIKNYSYGSYPALYRLADSETQLINNKPLWLESFPNLKVLNDNIFAKIPQTYTFIEDLRRRSILAISTSLNQ